MTQNEEKQEEASQEQEREPLEVTITDIELEQLKQEAQEYKEKYLRTLAESENVRKRLQKERQEMTQYALQSVICDFLQPIDQMGNALKHSEKMSEEVKQWCLGFRMIFDHFKEVLANNNVHSFTSQGKAFDPHLHEAVETVETEEHPAGAVVEESVKGYKMGEKVIRPARVTVAKAPGSNNGNNKTSGEEEL